MKIFYVLSLISLILVSFNFDQMQPENIQMYNPHQVAHNEAVTADSSVNIDDRRQLVLPKSRIFMSTRGL